MLDGNMANESLMSSLVTILNFKNKRYDKPIEAITARIIFKLV